MKLISAATAALFGITALAAPSACAPSQDTSATVYQIKNFTTRKYDGKTVALVFFNILATNGGTLNFECAPYDPATQATTDKFESGHVYFCGKNSLFSFNYNVDSTDLYLWQDIAPGNTIGGNITTGNPICRAGGSGVNDLVCTVPDVVKLDITMNKL